MGQSCDLAGPANNIIILIVDQTVNGAFVQLARSRQSFEFAQARRCQLQLSTSLIQYTGTGIGNLGIIVGDTNFVGPVEAVRDSASLANVQLRGGIRSIHSAVFSQIVRTGNRLV